MGNFRMLCLECGFPEKILQQSVNRFSSSFSSYKQRTTYFFCKYLIIVPSFSHAKYFLPQFAISQHEKIIGQGISFKRRSINTRQYKLYKKYFCTISQRDSNYRGRKLFSANSRQKNGPSRQQRCPYQAKYDKKI